MNHHLARHARALHRAVLTASVSLSLAVSLAAQNLQWRPAFEPGVGGAVTAISVSPHDVNRVLVGGDMLGVALSEDGGVNWDQTVGSFRTSEINSFTWHPNPSSALEVWAGTAHGPYKSTDGGNTWTVKRLGLPLDAESGGGAQKFNASIQSILFTPGDPTRMLAVVGNRRTWFSTNTAKYGNVGKVYVSTDSGENWALLSTITPTVSGRLLNTMHAAYGGGASSTTIYAAIDRYGVYRSIDNGVSWAKITTTGLPTAAIKSMWTHPTDPARVWVSLAGGYGVYSSGNANATLATSVTWAAKNSGITETGTFEYITGGLTASGTAVRLLVMNFEEKKLYRSENGGDSWVLVPQQTTNSAYGWGYSLGVIGMAPSDPQRAFVSGMDLYRSTNGAVSFSTVSAYRPDPAQTGYWTGLGYSGLVSLNVKWNPANPQQALLMAMDDGLWTTFNSFGSFKRGSASGILKWSGINDASFSADGQTVYVGRGQGGYDYSPAVGVYKSVNGGLSYTVCGYPAGLNIGIGSNMARSVYCIPSEPSKVWAIFGSKLYKSINSGASWTLNTSIDDVNHAEDNLAAAYKTQPGRLNQIQATDPANPYAFYVSGQIGIWKTENGDDFVKMPGSPQNWKYGCTQLSADPTRPEILYATNWQALNGNDAVWRYDPAYASTNGWRKLTNTYNHPVKAAFTVTVDPSNNNRLVVCTNKDPLDDVATTTGVWMTLNGNAASGITWTQQNTGLGMLRAKTVRFSPDGSQIVLGTNGGGFYVANGNGTALEHSFTSPAEADAFVRDGTASTNYGTSPLLTVKKDAGGYTRAAYTRFNVPAYGGNVTSAKVRLYGQKSAGSLNPRLVIAGVADPDWLESGAGGITWSTRPAEGAQIGSPVSITSTAGQYWEWDVTNYVQQQRLAGNVKIGFVVKSLDTVSAEVINFNSREATENKPQLVVNSEW